MTDITTDSVPTIDHSMHTALFNPATNVWGVSQVGCGGIGSQLAEDLGRLGVDHVHFYDDDVVEEGNLAYQAFTQEDIGEFKAEALRSKLLAIGYPNVTAHVARVDKHTHLDGVVISGVDSMASRRIIWDRVKWNPNVYLYIDLRIGGEHVRMLTVDPADPEQVERYEETLVSDSDTAQLPCAARAVVYPAATVANWAITQLSKYGRNQPLPWKVECTVTDFMVLAFMD